MPVPPMPIPYARRTDLDHLRVLAVLHFVIAGLAVVGLVFLFLHYLVMRTMIGSPEIWNQTGGGGPNPEQFFGLFKWFYLFMAVVLVAGGVANLLSGLFIQKRRNRLFSLIVAGVNCLQVPLGTALGVFSFIVLLRPSVRDLYLED
jgi:hypothetical protein